MIKSTTRMIDEFFYFLITHTFGFFIGFFFMNFFFNNPKWFRTDIQVTFIKSTYELFFYNYQLFVAIQFFIFILYQLLSFNFNEFFSCTTLVYFSFALWSYLQDILNITFLIVYEELIYMVMIFIFLNFYLGYG